MPDSIHIEDLSVRTIIGVNAWERETPQTLRLTLVLELPLAQAAASDSVADTLSYAEAADLIREHLTANHYLLIERLADQVAQTLLDTYRRLQAVTITVRKEDVVPGSAAVAVHLRRTRRSQGLEQITTGTG